MLINHQRQHVNASTSATPTIDEISRIVQNAAAAVSGELKTSMLVLYSNCLDYEMRRFHVDNIMHHPSVITAAVDRVPCFALTVQCLP